MNFKDIKESENIYKIFVDFGYSKCTVGLSAFQKSSFRVLQTFSEPNCGGRMMDMLIVNYLSRMFFSKNQIDIFSNKKSVLKLLTEVQKSRKILTSNKDIQINVEFIINELDLIHIFTREEFEKICAPVFEKFELLLLSCRKYIDSMNLTDKITIEMAGECMRTPLAQSLVKKVFNQGISKTILIDECVAKGCSIYVIKQLKLE
jgi:heat shock protein 4